MSETQLFTDVWGANRAGIMSILVKPIAKKEEIQIVLKRYLEKIVLIFYKRNTKRVSKNAKTEKNNNEYILIRKKNNDGN